MSFYQQYGELVRKFGTPEEGALQTYEYVIEECSELIHAIQCYKRGRENAFQNLVNEMADVYTLLDALCYYLGISEEKIQYYQTRLIMRYLNRPNDGSHVPALIEDK